MGRRSPTDSCMYVETRGKALFIILRAHSPLAQHFTLRRAASPVSLKSAWTQVEPAWTKVQ